MEIRFLTWIRLRAIDDEVNNRQYSPSLTQRDF